MRGVVAQATMIPVITLVVGAPLGALARRVAWINFADGMPARTVIELPTIALVVVATVLLSNLVGAIPGFFAARVRPATVLRTK